MPRKKVKDCKVCKKRPVWTQKKKNRRVEHAVCKRCFVNGAIIVIGEGLINYPKLKLGVLFLPSNH